YGLNAGFDAANINQLRRYSGGSAVMSLSIPLWNFGASKSRATQARLRARALELQRDNLTQQLRQEFYTERAAALSALARIKFAETAANAAQENLNLIFIRYRQNQAQITDVIDAQANYAATRLAYYQAIVDYRTARVRLEVDPAQALTAQGTPSLVSPPNVQRCTLTAAQAPTLGGLRLGMTVEQAKTIYPALSIEQSNDLGVALAVVHREALGQQAVVLPLAADIDTLTLEFTDGLLTRVRVSYQPTSKWESKDQFVSVMAARLGVPGPWEAFYDWQYKSIRNQQDLRDLAYECAGFRLNVGIGIEGIGADQTPHIELTDIRAVQTIMQREDEQHRREAEQKEKPKQP